MRRIATIFFLFLFNSVLFASELIEILPLTDQIIMLHYDDGYVRHHGAGEPNSMEWVIHNPLDLVAATQLSAYSMNSSDDLVFANGLSPLQIGQKTKGTDFTWLCESWNSAIGCVNTSADVAHEHWLYLFLPEAMQSGKSYTLQLHDGTSQTWVYNEKKLRSEAVHVNQVAYSTKAAEKFGYVYHWLGTEGGLDVDLAGRTFHIIDAVTESIEFSGQTTFRKEADNVETAWTDDSPYGNFLGSKVFDCDFSTFTKAGNYKLVVEGVGSSFPFEIKADAYRVPYLAVMKGIFQQRSGIGLTAPYTTHLRPAPHNPLLTPGFAGRLKYTSTRLHDLLADDHSDDDKPAIVAGIKGPIDTWGWYQDAGDWDGYFRHTRVPIELLLLYEINPAAFSDGELNIPESGNGLPDLLDEAAWLLRFYQRTKSAAEAAGYTTGGVPGSRISGDWFGGDTDLEGNGQPSWEDTDRDWVILGEDVFTSYRYAGMAAHFAWILQENGFQDPQGIDWRTEAEKAYIWAQSNTVPSDYYPKNGQHLERERLYATANLYRLTGEVAYHNTFITDANTVVNDYGDAAYQMDEAVYDDWAYPVFVYLSMNTSATNASLRSLFLSINNATANFLLNFAVEDRACRWGGNYWMPMLVGQGTTPLINSAIYATHIGAQNNVANVDVWKKNLYNTADYFLGNNPLNMSWITGVGERHPEEIFHLDWWFSDYDSIHIGVVPYGPWRQLGLTQLGPYTHMWANKTLTPNIENWPGHERWFEMRTAPLHSEFTIEQNQLPTAILCAFLSMDSIYTNSVSVALLANEKRTLGVYPNPIQAGRTLKIQNKGVTIQSFQLLNGVGQVVYQAFTPDEGGFLFWKCPIEFNAGVYFLRVVHTDGTMESVPIVVEK